MRIRVAEKSVTSTCELRESRSPSPRRRHRHFEKSVPIAGDAMVAARLNPTLPCTTDESLATQERHRADWQARESAHASSPWLSCDRRR